MSPAAVRLSPDVDVPHHVLVHGGSHGAWCWDEVIAGLALAGVTASALDLPGCGADTTPRDQVTVTDCVAAVVAHIDSLPDPSVRVVGHSIAGWLLPSIAAARSSRIDQLVFLAAATLNRGERGIDVTPQERRAGYFEMAAASDDNSLLPPFDNAWARFFPSLPQAEAEQVYARLTPQPFGPYLEPAVTGAEDLGAPRRYLQLTDDKTFPIETSSAFAAKAGAPPEPLPGDHCIMLTDPAVLVAALMAMP